MVGTALLCVVQFMVVLDIAIVNVALPSIQEDLGFSQENLQWVISAYALVFGGFLLLGGRLADLLGRRRVFMVGLRRSSRSASLLCGALVVRGLADRRAGAAGPRRGHALAGGARDPHRHVRRGPRAQHRARRLGRDRRVRRRRRRAARRRSSTELLSWEWIFFVNVPVGLVALVADPRARPGEPRPARRRRSTSRAPCSITAGLGRARPRDHPGERAGAGPPARTLGRVRALGRRCTSGSSSGSAGARSRSCRCRSSGVKTVLGANITGFILGHDPLLDVPHAHALHAAGAAG